MAKLEDGHIDIVKEIAETHWKWIETWLHIIYVDAFIHGYKHGQEMPKKPIKKGNRG